MCNRPVAEEGQENLNAIVMLNEKEDVWLFDKMYRCHLWSKDSLEIVYCLLS